MDKSFQYFESLKPVALRPPVLCIETNLSEPKEKYRQDTNLTNKHRCDTNQALLKTNSNIKRPNNKLG